MLGQGAQQLGTALRHIDKAQFGEPSRPKLGRDPQRRRRYLPVLRELTGRERHGVGRKLDFLDGGGVDGGGQRVSELEHPGSAVTGEVLQMIMHQPRQLEPPPQRTDGRRKIERQIARFERRLAFLQIAEREDLREQYRTAPRRCHESFGQRPGAAPTGGQHGRLGQPRGIAPADVFEQYSGEVDQERPVRVD